MKTKKTLLVLLSSALLITAFAGCSSGKKSDKNADGKSFISVGNWPAQNTTDTNYLETITRQKTEFESENPDWAIEPDTWKFDLDTFYSKAASRQLPTLYYSNFTEIGKIVSGEYYTDISAGLKRAGYEGKFNPAVLKLISNGDEIVTFPTDTYSLGIAYNVDLFKKAGLMNSDGTPKQPKDWNEVAEFGKKIKESTGKAGFAIPTMANCGGWLFTPIAWSYGVEFMKADKDNNYTATFNSQEMIDALQYISDLKWKNGIFLDNSLIDLTEYYKQFAIGNIGMILTAGNVTSQLVQYDMPLDHIGMMAIPAGPKKHITLTGGYTATIADGATDEQVDIAIKWLEKVGSGDVLTDSVKQTIETGYKRAADRNEAVGVESLSVWNSETEIEKFRKEVREKYVNIDLNHVKLYNEALSDTDIELQPEEPVCAQELYAVLDGIIQEILTNKNADIKGLVEKANADFQANYLNNLD
ncbi:MAG: extracellular solute-binding protein [Clostridia bacterium]|nr:extracellular solute-binding protein [Clostridia bacterium]